jgi:hypothetical protein
VRDAQPGVLIAQAWLMQALAVDGNAATGE